MPSNESTEERRIQDAVRGLSNGDFSRLAQLFDDESGPSLFVDWCRKGHFDSDPATMAEALSCACFLGRTRIAEFLVARGVDPSAGNKTDLNGFHWAANRGNLETVEFLIRRNAPLEELNIYGGTVLGTAVWSAIHEPRPDHLAIIEALARAGAELDAVQLPTGNDQIDGLLQRLGANP